MKLEFEPPRIESDYYDTKKNKKKYGVVFAEGLEKLLGALNVAECAYDIKVLPWFRMHLLHGDMKGVYSLSPDNKKSKWRVTAVCVDENDQACSPGDNEEEFLKGIKKLRLREVGDYHD